MKRYEIIDQLSELTDYYEKHIIPIKEKSILSKEQQLIADSNCAISQAKFIVKNALNDQYVNKLEREVNSCLKALLDIYSEVKYLKGADKIRKNINNVLCNTFIKDE